MQWQDAAIRACCSRHRSPEQGKVNRLVQASLSVIRAWVLTVEGEYEMASSLVSAERGSIGALAP